jgi:hypothetical protein
MDAGNGIMSPTQRKWHFYGRSKKKRVKGDNIQFLTFIALHRNIIVARKLAISPAIRKITPYLDESKYIEFKIKIEKMRTRIDTNDFYKLYNKQKGICEFCNQLMVFECIMEDNKPEKLEIHHIKPLLIGGKHSGYSNKSLIHKSCHSRVHQIYGKNQITKMPFRKFN